MTVLSQRIGQRRGLLRLSQEDLADAIGSSQRQISKYEIGKNNPTAEVLGRIAIALDTTSDWLLGLTDNPDRPLSGESDLDDTELEIIRLVRARNPGERQKIVNVIKALA